MPARRKSNFDKEDSMVPSVEDNMATGQDRELLTRCHRRCFTERLGPSCVEVGFTLYPSPGNGIVQTKAD